MIICLVGSMKFWNRMLKIYEEFSNDGYIVLLPVLNGKDKDSLMELHRRKIDLADIVYVVNKNGYMGSDTLKEISYAISQSKEIMFLEKII